MYLPLEAGINFTGLNSVLGIIAGLVIVLAGIGIAHRGGKGDFRKAASSGGAVMIGVLVIAIGFSFAIASGMAQAAVAFLAG